MFLLMDGIRIKVTVAIEIKNGLKKKRENNRKKYGTTINAFVST